MQKLIIDRNIWLRGEGHLQSFLLRPVDQKQCCVGIYLEQCGIERTKLNGVKSVQGLVYGGNTIPQEAKWLCEVEDSEQLYNVNDSLRPTEPEREREITDTFAKHDVEVEFVN